MNPISVLLSPYRHSCIKTYRHKKVATIYTTKQHQRSQFALTPLACFCDKLVNSTDERETMRSWHGDSRFYRLGRDGGPSRGPYPTGWLPAGCLRCPRRGHAFIL